MNEHRTPRRRTPTPEELDEKVKLDVPFEDGLRVLLSVPAEPATDEPEADQ